MLEDQLLTERESRKTETSLLSSKLAVAQREVTSRDSAMLQLRTDAHNLQQVLDKAQSQPPVLAHSLPLLLPG